METLLTASSVLLFLHLFLVPSLLSLSFPSAYISILVFPRLSSSLHSRRCACILLLYSALKISNLLLSLRWFHFRFSHVFLKASFKSSATDAFLFCCWDLSTSPLVCFNWALISSISASIPSPSLASCHSSAISTAACCREFSKGGLQMWILHAMLCLIRRAVFCAYVRFFLHLEKYCSTLLPVYHTQ